MCTPVPLETSHSVLLNMLALESPASFPTMGTAENHMLQPCLTSDQADATSLRLVCRSSHSRCRLRLTLHLKDLRMIFSQIAEPKDTIVHGEWHG